MTELVAATFIRANNACPLSKRRVDAPFGSKIDAAVEDAYLLLGGQLLLMVIVILLMLQIEEFGRGWFRACCRGAFYMGRMMVLLGYLSSRRLCFIQSIALEKATRKTLLLFVLT